MSDYLYNLIKPIITLFSRVRLHVFITGLFFSVYIYPSSAEILFDSADASIRQLLVSANKNKQLNPEAGLHYAREALEKSQEINDIAGEIFALILHGNAMDEMHKDMEADVYYESALSIDLVNSELSDDAEILYMLTYALRSSRQYNLAQNYLDKSIKIHTSPSFLARAYTQKAILYYREKTFQNAVTAGLKALELITNETPKTEQISINTIIAKAYNKLENHTQSRNYNLHALALAREVGNLKIIAETLENTSVDQTSLGEYSQALTNAREALSIQRAQNDMSRISNLLLNISVIYMRLGRYDESLAYALELLAIDEQQDNLNRIASTSNQIGRIYERLKQHDEAMYYFDNVLALDKTKVNPRYRASALRSISSIKNKAGDFPSALDFAMQSKAIYIETNNLKGIGSAERAIANIYKQMNNNSASELHYENAIAIAVKLNDSWSEASSRIHIGTLSLNSDIKKARANLSLGLDIAQKLDSKGLQLEAHRGFVTLERNLGNFKEALTHYDNAYRLAQEIDNKEIDDRIAELKVIHETEQAEREIQNLKQEKYINDIELQRKNIELENLNAKNTIAALKLKEERFRRIVFFTLTILIALTLAFVLMRYKYLTHSQKILNDKNVEIEKKNASLEELNLTKNRFFSIISHDLRSPITAIVGLSDLLIENIESYSKAEIKSHAKSINNISNQTFSLLENLLSWAILQIRNTHPIPKKHAIASIFETAICHIHTAAEIKEITIKNDINKNVFIYADKNMITTVVRNILNNAIKFTPHNGVIHLFCESHNNNLFVHIKDSGVGIEDKLLKNIFKKDVLLTEKGTDGEAGTGFGLALSKELIEKNQGKLFVKSKKGEGSDFYFYLPQNPLPKN